MKSLDAHDADNGTEYIGLLKVDVDEFGCTIFDVLDGFANVVNIQFGRKRHRPVEALRIESHYNCKFSRLAE
jgi:hypothetical protein